MAYGNPGGSLSGAVGIHVLRFTFHVNKLASY